MGAHVVGGGVEEWLPNDVAKEGDEDSALFYEEFPANGRDIFHLFSICQSILGGIACC